MVRKSAKASVANVVRFDFLSPVNFNTCPYILVGELPNEQHTAIIRPSYARLVLSPHGARLKRFLSVSIRRRWRQVSCLEKLQAIQVLSCCWSSMLLRILALTESLNPLNGRPVIDSHSPSSRMNQCQKAIAMCR